MISEEEWNSLASFIFKKVEKHLDVTSLEFEFRFCRYSDEVVAKMAKKNVASVPPRLLKNTKVDMGISKEDFDALRGLLMARVTESEFKRVKREVADTPLDHSTSVTEDVFHQGCRYSYEVQPSEEGEKKVLLGIVSKKQLMRADFFFSSLPYGIRIGVNEERIQDVPDPDVTVKGFSRRKVRETFVDREHLLRYDLTKVITRGEETFEVEMEGVFMNPRVQLSEPWIRAALETITKTMKSVADP